MKRDDALRTIIRIVLIEGIIDDLRKKYFNRKDELEELLKKVEKKFVLWAAKQVFELNEPLGEVIEMTRVFSKSLQRLEKKDINAYKTLGELRDAVEGLGKSRGDEVRDIKSDADVIYEKGDIIVIHPKTTSASCHYGKGSRWCIAATKSKNYFDSYSSGNIMFYFVINKRKPADDPTHKIAIVVPRDEQNKVRHSLQGWTGTTVHAFDATDKMMQLPEAIEAIGPGGEHIVELCISDAGVKPINAQYEIRNTTDPERLRELAKSGKYDETLVQNRSIPEDVIRLLFKRKNIDRTRLVGLPNAPEDLKNVIMGGASDKEMKDVVQDMDSIDPGLLRSLAERGFWQALTTALIMTQHDNVVIPDDVSQWVIQNGDDEMVYVLARNDGISSEIAFTLARRGGRAAQGLAENKAHFDDVIEHLIGKTDDETLLQTASYTGSLKAYGLMWHDLGSEEQHDVRHSLLVRLFRQNQELKDEDRDRTEALQFIKEHDIKFSPFTIRQFVGQHADDAAQKLGQEKPSITMMSQLDSIGALVGDEHEDDES